MSAPGRALSVSLVTCPTCALLLRLPRRGHALGCPRCGHAVHPRKPDSVRRT